jgi:hypothetical protein
VLILTSFLSLSILLILLDIFSGYTGWGLKLGIPLLLAVYFVISIFILMIKKAKEKQLNLIAYFFIASGVLSICVEGIISFYTNKMLKLHWSLLVIASVIPVAAILFFIHYRLKKGADLKRFFHI